MGKGEKDRQTERERKRALLSHAFGVLCRDYSLEGFYRFLARAKQEENHLHETENAP